MFLYKSFCNNNLQKLLLKNNFKFTQNAFHSKRLFSISTKNDNKTENVKITKDIDEGLKEFYLPEPPTSPELLESLNSPDLYNHLGEATFASLGLNSYWPTGWVQAAFETLHVNCNLPWWAAIAISAIAVRTAMFPVSIKIRKLGATAKAIGPLITKLQRTLEEAKIANDMLTVSKSVLELQNILTKSKYKPYQTLIYSFLQIPPFLAIMMGLRQMASLPVASLQSGGLFWFTDLTLCDPYYVLPCTTMLLLLFQIEIGADIAKQNQSNNMKWVIRAFPLIGLIFTCNFPSALLLYWTCSSFISLGIVGLLKLPPVKHHFRLDEQFAAASAAPEAKTLGFFKNWKKDTADNAILKRAKKLESSDNERWLKAGKGSIPKTYTYNPTKVGSVQNK